MAAPDAATLNARVEQVRDLLRLHAGATRTDRKVRPENIAAMRETGLFRLCQPGRIGGWELGLAQMHGTVATLAETCPASAWVLMVLTAHTWMLGMFPEAAQDEIAADDPDTLVAGSLAAAGSAKPVQGGWRVSGRWPFASGCDHARWNLIGVKVEPGEDRPVQIHALAPLRDYRISDNWHVMGLEGTGSKELVLDGVFVPAHRTVPTGTLFLGRSEAARRHATGLYLNPVASGLAYHVSAAVLGIARAMLREMLSATAVRGDKYTGTKKAESAGLQMRIATADAEIKAAAALLAEAARDFTLLSDARQVADVPLRSDLRMRITYAVQLCRNAADRLFAAAGANAAYLSSPLQGLFRDMHVATHHAMVDLDSAAEARGRILLGLPPGTAVL